jgi:hypothetical protein
MRAMLCRWRERLENWYTWRQVRRYCEKEARVGVGDAETEAMAQHLRCVVDFQPCDCASGCARDPTIPAGEVDEARAKIVWIGRFNHALRRVAFTVPDEPSLQEKAAEADRLLAGLREKGSL